MLTVTHKFLHLFYRSKYHKLPIPVADRLLGLWVQILPGAWMSVSCKSGESYLLWVCLRVWCVNLSNKVALTRVGLLCQGRRREECR